MANKVQISCNYQPDEDRILMRARLTDKDARMWLTRRMVLQFLASIGKIFDHLTGTQAQPTEQRQAVADFRRDAAVSQANFQTPYDDDGLEPYPADGPLLVKKLNVAALDNGGVRLTFTGTTTDGVRLNLGEKELHAVVHMLRQTAEKAQWALGAHLGPVQDAAKSAPAKPKVLN
ncbi:MAG: hypothetical protein R8L07_21460 [Alphaproteobacteria bacterium]|nr:hypothetical protein [Alphaproteobacteria bacterium]